MLKTRKIQEDSLLQYCCLERLVKVKISKLIDRGGLAMSSSSRSQLCSPTIPGKETWHEPCRSSCSAWKIEPGQPCWSALSFAMVRARAGNRSLNRLNEGP